MICLIISLLNKTVFLDRDGVINKKRDDYVKNINEFVMLGDSSKAIKLLNDENYLVIVITNQSAINRGLLTHEELSEIHKVMSQELEKNNARVDAIYYCPHRPDENCQCRKPRTELIERAVREHSVSIDQSWFVGDSESDIMAAKNIGLRSILMKENGSLLDAVSRIIYV